MTKTEIRKICYKEWTAVMDQEPNLDTVLGQELDLRDIKAYRIGLFMTRK